MSYLKKKKQKKKNADSLKNKKKTKTKTKEKKNLRPLDIVYEPTKNVSEPIRCYFAPKIYLPFSSYYTWGEKTNRTHTAAKQCPYCQNFFLKTEEKMEKNVKCCAGQAGYSLVFDQSVVNYQENFNKIGDVPFSIYYDFETTTGSAIYTNAKVHVVSYCMIVAFHAELKMPPLVIYRASDQSLPQLRSLHYLDQVKKDFLSHRLVGTVFCRVEVCVWRPQKMFFYRG